MKDELVHWDKLVGFTPKQLEAYKAIYKYPFLLYGGARGGGKSYWGRWSLASFHLYWAAKGVTNLTTGIFSRTYTDLQERQIAKIGAEFPEWFGTLKESREHGLAFYINPKYGGGAITLKNLDDTSKYKSAEFAAIFVDELTENQIDIFNTLLGSLRWAGMSHTPFFAGSNPDGIGNEWVYNYFIDHVYPPEMQNMSDKFHFVQSKPGDNPYLDDNYYQMLNSLPPDLKKAWVDGEWNLFKGLAFKSFRKDTHVIEPFYIPEHWARIIGIDSGYAAPFCCLFGARNPDNGRIYIYKEIYKTELTDQQQARLILDYCDPEERMAVKYADPAMWVRKTQREVTSSSKIYAENGLFLRKGNNDRIQGKRQVDRLLQQLPDGDPGIVFFENCTNIIKQLSHLVYDKNNPEDVDTRAEDHAYDALKYLLTSVGDYKKQPPIMQTTSPFAKLTRI
jgi:PBSX family phage terminase large subunit